MLTSNCPEFVNAIKTDTGFPPTTCVVLEKRIEERQAASTLFYTHTRAVYEMATHDLQAAAACVCVCVLGA